MKAYLEKLAEDYDKALEVICDNDKVFDSKITGKLMPGARCAWCYKEDDEFWKSENKKHGDFPYPHPKDWPYRGFLIPFPETSGRNEMEQECVCVVIVDYPIEKENPVTDWATFASVVSREDLHRFYIFEEIKLQRQ